MSALEAKAGMFKVALLSACLLAAAPVGAQDAKKGEELAQQQCAACHGKDFVTGLDPTYPRLAGQYQDYLEKVLRDYKSGARKNPIMNGIAKPLTRDDIRNVAAYLSALSGPLSNTDALVLTRAALQAVQIARAHLVGGHCLTRALRAPHRFTEAFHHVVHRRVLVAAPRDKLSKNGTDAWRLIDRKLLCDRQVHRHVQKRIGAPVFDHVLTRKGGVQVIELAVIFGMFQHPIEGNGFQG